ncbi:hypothetical protein PoB_004974700 [Plakobranchus ocellatus]|uniref:Uncharacterized protein n=1 Tax=Plakobranchus ocellatus TaxID=259542 RepID=A0AAV4BVP5_9GAST|nr:hypothetical protein PoB_004974700 [Plakobranchus ocellatus]
MAYSTSTFRSTKRFRPSANFKRSGAVHASPQQDDLRLSYPPPGQGIGNGARTRDRRIPEDIRADSLEPLCHRRPVVLKLASIATFQPV